MSRDEALVSYDIQVADDPNELRLVAVADMWMLQSDVWKFRRRIQMPCGKPLSAVK